MHLEESVRGTEVERQVESYPWQKPEFFSMLERSLVLGKNLLSQ